MITSILSRGIQVHVADTEEKREACGRFAYRVYVQEMGYTPAGTDHERRIVWDELDAAPSATHLYVGNSDAISGMIRLLAWDAGQMDPHFYEAYQVDRFSPAVSDPRTGEIGRLMILPSARGKMTVPSLVKSTFEHLVIEKNCDLLFAESRPGLVGPYGKLGMRPYDAPPIRTPEGFMVPLVCIPTDAAYHKAKKTLIASQVAKASKDPHRRKVDVGQIESLFDVSKHPIQLDAGTIWKTAEANLRALPEPPDILRGLDERALRTILEGAVVLHLPEGGELAVAQRSERELFIVLAGRFEILVEGDRVADCSVGEVIGEMAFFRDEGVRSATVKARQPSEVLVMSRRFFDRLRKSHPDEAFQLLFNLGHILADRLAATTAVATTTADS